MDKMQSEQHTLRQETLTHNTLNCIVCLKKHPINNLLSFSSADASIVNDSITQLSHCLYLSALAIAISNIYHSVDMLHQRWVEHSALEPYIFSGKCR